MLEQVELIDGENRMPIDDYCTDALLEDCTCDYPGHDCAECGGDDCGLACQGVGHDRSAYDVEQLARDIERYGEMDVYQDRESYPDPRYGYAISRLPDGRYRVQFFDGAATEADGTVYGSANDAAAHVIQHMTR